MKQTQSKKHLENAAKLISLIEKRKKIEKEEKELKSHFKAHMNEIGELNLKAGNIMINLTDVIKTSLDKKALINDHGEDFVKKYENQTEYQKMEVKKV